MKHYILNIECVDRQVDEMEPVVDLVELTEDGCLAELSMILSDPYEGVPQRELPENPLR